MYRPYQWLWSILGVVVFLSLVTTIGYFIDQIMAALLIGFFAVISLLYFRLYRLDYWLWRSKKISPPTESGIWAHIYLGIYNATVKNRNKRKSLAEILRRYRQGSEALPDAAVVVDGSGKITWCNRLARIELGLRLPEDIGQRIYKIISDPKLSEIYHANRFEKPIEITSPINLNKVLELRIVHYEEDHLMILVRDVTRLTQIENMRKDFVANVSHELRTPLTVINGYLEMLPENGDMPKPIIQKAISEMRSQSLRMQNLIEELLVLSRIEGSAERTFEKLVNVPQILWQIQVEAGALNRKRQHKIFFDISPILYVYGLETELRSAFSNLIFNAINYTPNGGVIEVKWSLEGDQARFSVKDNGDGVAKEHIDRITERFYRVDRARSRTTGGSGLGLAIVKHVLSHHNSILCIESVLSRGSTFSCRFSTELTYLVDNV
jgi:two-component system phosphate regulon sensor histidine kinase PhoR